jgi:hypothetical protein
MNIFSYLFQPDKSKLSPIGRAFIAWLEIVIITVITTGAGAGLDYLNGHPEDIKGIFPYIAYAVVIALLKALTTLGVSLKNTSVIETPPPVQAAPAPQAAAPAPIPIFVQMPAPAPSPTPSPASWAAPVMQFKAPAPIPTQAPANVWADTATASLPIVPNDDRGWTALEMPAVGPPS